MPSQLSHDALTLYRATMDFIRFYQFRDRDRAVRHQLTVAHCHVIDCLLRDGPMSLNALAARLYLDKSTTSRIVETMRDRRLVRCARNRGDGRAILISVSAAGRERYGRVVEAIVDQDCELLADFPPATRRRLVTLIEELTRLAVERDRLANDKIVREQAPRVARA